MILSIFKKYSEINKKKKLIITIIQNLKINEKQKSLYLDSLDLLDEIWLEKLYKSLMLFVEEVENRDFESIKATNFSQITWMRKKEAVERQKEVNTFNFLLNNL